MWQTFNYCKWPQRWTVLSPMGYIASKWINVAASSDLEEMLERSGCVLSLCSIWQTIISNLNLIDLILGSCILHVAKFSFLSMATMDYVISQLKPY